MGPLLILACILVGVLGGLYFLFVLPVIVGVLALAYRKSRRLTTSLSVAVVMLLAFYISVALTWILIAPGWDLSLITTFKAAGVLGGLGEAGGNSLDDAAEGILAALLIISTLSTVAAGIVTATARYVWVKYRHLPV